MAYMRAFIESLELVMDKYHDRVNIPFMEAALEGAKAIFEEYGQAPAPPPAQNTNAPPQSSCISNTTSAKALGCNHDFHNPGFIEKGIERGFRQLPVKKVKERNVCLPKEQRELYHIDIQHGWADNVRDYFAGKEKPQDYNRLMELARKWDEEGYAVSNVLNTQIHYNDEATVKKLREVISINSPSRYTKSSSTTPGK